MRCVLFILYSNNLLIELPFLVSSSSLVSLNNQFFTQLYLHLQNYYVHQTITLHNEKCIEQIESVIILKDFIKRKEILIMYHQYIHIECYTIIRCDNKLFLLGIISKWRTAIKLGKHHY